MPKPRTAQWLQRKCPHCAKSFECPAYDAKTFCSRECLQAAKWHKRKTVKCPQCKTPFRATWQGNMGKYQTHCSAKCAGLTKEREGSPAWKGGILKIGPRVKEMKILDGYVTKYQLQHRLIASRALGRPLSRREIVLHLNRQRSDNRLANLYVCRDRSEASTLLQDGAPWPEQSNLPQLETAHAQA